MRVLDDVAASRLAKHHVQSHHRRRAGVDDIAQHVARAHRRQLVDVADQQQMGAGRDRLQQAVGEQQVQHRRLVYDHHVGSQRIVLVAPETKSTFPARTELQQAVDGFCLLAGCLA